MNGCSCLAAPTSRVGWIDDACEDAVALARLRGEALVVVVMPVPLDADPSAAFVAAAGRRRVLERSDAVWRLAVGSAWQVTASGPGRTSWLAQAWAARLAQAIVRSPVPGSPAVPVAVGAWAFEEAGLSQSAWGARLDGARLTIPRLLWWRDAEGRGWEIRARSVAPSEDPGVVAADLLAAPPAEPTVPATPWPPLATDFLVQVEDAVSLINDGALRKVVLARAVDEPLRSDEATVLARLATVAGSHLYACDLDDGGLLVGATPEVLFTAHGVHLTTMALAATIPRGESAGEDLARLAELLSSTKSRKEHGVVVEHLAAALRPRASRFAVPGTPHQRVAGGLLHLETLLAVDLHRPDYLDAIAALHPTPAVCGLPTPTAAHYLARHEGLQRGLYTGLIGWLSPAMAHLLVPLRGGILHADRTKARVFAGAGIVETSDPQAEWAETEAKLGLMRMAIA